MRIFILNITSIQTIIKLINSFWFNLFDFFFTKLEKSDFELSKISF